MKSTNIGMFVTVLSCIVLSTFSSINGINVRSEAPTYINNQRLTYLSENFESATFPPTGWTTSTSPSWVRTISSTYIINGSTSAMLRKTENSNNIRLITPQVRITSASTLSFMAKRSSLDSSESIRIRYSSNLISWTTISTFVLTAQATFYQADLSSFSPGDYYLCFETYSSNTGSAYKTYIIDDISGPALTSSILFGNLEGNVYQINSSNPISGARLFTSDSEVFSDASGYYSFENHNCGDFVLSCQASGYNTTVMPVTVSTGETHTYNFYLIPENYIPAIPTNMSVTRVDNGFFLSWADSEFAQRYHIYFCTSPYGNFLNLHETAINEIFIGDTILQSHGVDTNSVFFQIRADSAIGTMNNEQ